MRVLVTRPEPDGERTAAALRTAGVDVLLAPLLQLESVVCAPGPGPGPWQAVVFTSANAVRASAALIAALRAVPVVTVGDRTAAAARRAGFADVVSAGGNKDDLVALLARRPRGRGPLLYLSGEARAGDLAADLAPHEIPVVTQVVYRMRAAGALPAAVADALRDGRLDAVLHYSRRSAETFVALACAEGLLPQARRLVHHCLSPAVAEPLETAGIADLRIAPRPEGRAMIEQVAAAIRSQGDNQIG